ncbi:MAG: hypothetical protein HQL77_15835 [Magnetococcales bacterium]|nr:hypothetical protein [Magnetococcales bacterium]
MPSMIHDQVTEKITDQVTERVADQATGEMTDQDAIAFAKELKEISNRGNIQGLLNQTLPNSGRSLTEISRVGLKTLKDNPKRFVGIFK